MTRDVLEQIKTVCEANAPSTCDHRAALKFVWSVAANALTATPSEARVSEAMVRTPLMEEEFIAKAVYAAMDELADHNSTASVVENLKEALALTRQRTGRMSSCIVNLREALQTIADWYAGHEATEYTPLWEVKRKARAALSAAPALPSSATGDSRYDELLASYINCAQTLKQAGKTICELEARLVMAERLSRALPSSTEWKPISEAPTFLRSLFGYWSNTGEWYQRTFDGSYEPISYGYTHFMPLPQPPEGEK